MQFDEAAQDAILFRFFSLIQQAEFSGTDDDKSVINSETPPDTPQTVSPIEHTPTHSHKYFKSCHGIIGSTKAPPTPPTPPQTQSTTLLEKIHIPSKTTLSSIAKFKKTEDALPAPPNILSDSTLSKKTLITTKIHDLWTTSKTTLQNTPHSLKHGAKAAGWATVSACTTECLLSTLEESVDVYYHKKSPLQLAKNVTKNIWDLGKIVLPTSLATTTTLAALPVLVPVFIAASVPVGIVGAYEGVKRGVRLWDKIRLWRLVFCSGRVRLIRWEGVLYLFDGEFRCFECLKCFNGGGGKSGVMDRISRWRSVGEVDAGVQGSLCCMVSKVYYDLIYTELCMIMEAMWPVDVITYVVSTDRFKQTLSLIAGEVYIEAMMQSRDQDTACE